MVSSRFRKLRRWPETNAVFREVARPVGGWSTGTTACAELERALEVTEFDYDALDERFDLLLASSVRDEKPEFCPRWILIRRVGLIAVDTTVSRGFVPWLHVRSGRSFAPSPLSGFTDGPIWLCCDFYKLRGMTY